MTEDCQTCGTAIYELDEDGNCPGCSQEEECSTCEGTGYIDNPDHRTDRDNVAIDCPDCDDSCSCWEEQDLMENRCFYENDLEHLEELPQKEKM